MAQLPRKRPSRAKPTDLRRTVEKRLPSSTLIALSAWPRSCRRDRLRDPTAQRLAHRRRQHSTPCSVATTKQIATQTSKSQDHVLARRHENAGAAGLAPDTGVDGARLCPDVIAGIELLIVHH